MHYYPHHIGDYDRDTATLSLTEHGAYGKLMRSYYATEKPLPADHESLWRICGALTKPEREAVLLVASRYFQPTPEGLRHKRIEAELATYRAMLSGAAKGGRSSAQKRQQNRQAAGTQGQGGVAPPLGKGLPPSGKPPPHETATNQEPGTNNQRTATHERPAGARACEDEVENETHSDEEPSTPADDPPPPPQEAPAPLPPSEAQARAIAHTAGVPEDYAATLWHEMEAVGWIDSSGRAVSAFPSYLKARWNHRQSRHAREDKREELRLEHRHNRPTTPHHARTTSLPRRDSGDLNPASRYA